MSNSLKTLKETYELVLLSKQHIRKLYEWKESEKHFEYYTCQPLKSNKSFEEYMNNILKSISEKQTLIYVLIKKKSNYPFDQNNIIRYKYPKP